MKRLLYVISAFVIAIVIAVACTTEEEKKMFGDITGIVYDDNVGAPLPVAQVKLTPGGNTTVTGSDGSFSFTNVVPGDYTISVTKKGYDDGSNTVSVAAEKRSECYILMNRIPAYVTADKDTLDFGSNIALTTLSFNIVNSSYENLSWHINYDSTTFIKSVTPDKGTTSYGKTASIVVTIDRDKLNAGENVSTLVVVSDNGDGSSEVKLKAIGQERALATLNLVEITDITSSYATVTGEITFVGIPAYLERGFVYSTAQNPTINQTIEKVSVAVTEENSYSAKLSDLVLGNKYYVRAYAINGKGPAYSNQISFSTVASLPALSMYSVDHLDADNKTAVLHGSVDYIGDPAYTERGFVYAQNKNTPTLSDSHVKSEGSGIGTFAASISGLEFGKVYYARAYAINEGGPAYSKDSVMFTLTWTKPEVSVGETTEIDLSKPSAVLHGSLDKVGSPATTERGFVYSSTNNIPTINDNVIPVNGLTEGSYYYRIESLTLSKTYYVRAYAKNEIDVFYSANVTSFSTMPSLPVVSMRATPNLNLNSKTITLQGSVDYLGDPAYTEKGFVYSTTNQEPSINDAIIVSAGNGIGVFEATLDGLVLNKDYYVRAYIKNVSGVSYSDTILSFSTQPSLPSVSMRAVQNINREALTALLQGIVDDIGTPSFSEKGFVYSSTNDTPTLNDNFIKVEGASAGGYETTLNNLVLGATYYVRAYAIKCIG